MRAASLAAHLRETLGIEVVTEVGGRGQFDVFVDGEVVASRSKGLLQKLLGGGWPDPAAVAAAIAARR